MKKNASTKTKSKTIKDYTSNELVELAGYSGSKASNKHKAQSAQAELLRRNTQALRSSSASSQKHSRRILFLTVVLLTLALTEFILGVIPDSENPWERYILTLVIALVVLFLLSREVKKDDW